jgi:hypothetical protein
MKFIIAAFLAIPGFAQADDGVRSDSEMAHVERLIIYRSSYTLVVSPVDRSKPRKEYTPALRGCELFTVIGWFDESHWNDFRKKQKEYVGPTAQSHGAALDALQESFLNKSEIGFGYVGRNGFRPINSKAGRLSCVVESNGLELAHGKPFPIVFSWGDGI